jgi:hypothetical protein
MVRWCSVDPPMKHPAVPFLQQPVLPLLRVHKKPEKKQKRFQKIKFGPARFRVFPPFVGTSFAK